MKLETKIKILQSLFIFFLLHIATAHANEIKLETVSIYDIKDIDKKTEVISVQKSTQRIALSCSSKGIVDIISIQNPDAPKSLNRFNVIEGAEISSVAFHPTENYFAVSVINEDPFALGSIQIHNADTGKLLSTYHSGVHPDSLAFSPNGQYLIVANEGEAYRYNGKNYESPEGSITHLYFKDGLKEVIVTQIPLSDYTNVEGMLHKSHARKYERTVTGGNSEEEIKISIKDNTPANTEPEYVAFAPDSSKAFVSLQENNGVIVIDTASAKIESVYGLGITQHAADLKDNKKVNFNKTLTALREPDGIAISPDGKYLITADEGDTDPKVSKIKGNTPAGGGRTLSVFDAATGEFIADTGNQLDEMAHAVGLYADDRSEKKGSEPENVVSFEINSVLYAAVALERANAIALVSLKDPKNPIVVSVEPVDPEAVTGGKFAPEGLAHIEIINKHYIFSANEKSGTMTIMKIKTKSEKLAVN